MTKRRYHNTDCSKIGTARYTVNQLRSAYQDRSRFWIKVMIAMSWFFLGVIMGSSEGSFFGPQRIWIVLAAFATRINVFVLQYRLTKHIRLNGVHTNKRT